MREGLLREISGTGCPSDRDFISRSAVIEIIERERLLTGSRYEEYKLAKIQEGIEDLPVWKADQEGMENGLCG